MSVLERDAAVARRVGGMTLLETQVAARLRSYGQDRRAAELARLACRSTGHLLQISEQVECDPRWLLTGKSSPAGSAFVRRMNCSADGMALLGVRAESISLASIAFAVRQPPIALGVCRYCGCHAARSCGGGCRWVDHEETICSACVEVPCGDF